MISLSALIQSLVFKEDIIAFLESIPRGTHIFGILCIVVIVIVIGVVTTEEGRQFCAGVFTVLCGIGAVFILLLFID